MKSPLFISSMELIAHATELYSSKHERKYKFIILHLANSIELILKDRLLVEGVSIYEENTNRTIGVWQCFKELSKAGVAIPERPVIELLIDDRNTLQHRFGFPNGETVYFYLDEVVRFYSRFLVDEYKTALVDELMPYLKKEELELLGLTKEETHHLDKLKEVSIEMAILNAYTIMEGTYLKLRRESEQKVVVGKPIGQGIETLITNLVKLGRLRPDSVSEFHRLKALRNYIVHGQLENARVSREDLEKYFQISKDIVDAINKALKDNVISKGIVDDSEEAD